MMATSRVSSRASRGRYADTTHFNNNTKLSNIVRVVLQETSHFKNLQVISTNVFSNTMLLVFNVLFIAPLALGRTQRH